MPEVFDDLDKLPKYVANATYRIILQVENKVAKVVCIIAVGKREDLKAYKEADLRIKSNT